MLVEAGVITFLAYWLGNEYSYNAYFRAYLDQVFGGHVTTFSSILGVGIGLAGSAIAATLYRNLRNAKRKLETIATPRIRGAVDKILSGLPTLEDQSGLRMRQTTTSTPVRVPDQTELKKESN